MATNRTVAIAVGATALIAAIALGAAATLLPAPAEPREPETVVLVVLDTVRSQSTSLCGYERPNTPFLKELADGGAAWTCRAYTPGAWTLPSHSSFFSGQSVPEHGVVKTGVPFPEGVPTLAEIYKERGYQTLMVAANKSLSEASGLQRGFDHAWIRKGPNKVTGREVIGALKRYLAKADPEKPLFVFINIFDAHDPYPRVPPGVGWVPRQPEVKLNATDDDPNTAFNQFTGGTMTPDRQETWVAAIRNGYDYGIFLADKTLAAVFASLEEAGRLDGDHRWLVTSDHGEFIGEHGNLRHGCFVYEEVTRVPLLYYDSTVEVQPTLGTPFSATNAFFLLRDGKLPEIVPRANSVSKQRAPGRPSADMAGLWDGEHDKVVWKDGEYLRFDLEGDLAEQAPAPLGEHALRPELEAFTAAHRAALDADVEVSDELRQMLEDLGYVGND